MAAQAEESCCCGALPGQRLAASLGGGRPKWFASASEQTRKGGNFVTPGGWVCNAAWIVRLAALTSASHSQTDEMLFRHYQSI
jgi:hypothetical protein